MNILVLTNVYPGTEEMGNNNITRVVPFFCHKWVEQGHNVIAINNISSFPSIYAEGYVLLMKLLKPFTGKEVPDISYFRNNFKIRQFEDHGVSVHVLPMRKMLPHGFFSNKEFSKQIEKIIGILNKEHFVPDVITGHWMNPQLRLVAELGEHFKSAKTGFVFHNDQNGEGIRKFNAQHWIMKIDNVGGRSRQAVEEIKRNLKTNNTPFICYSGVADEYANDITVDTYKRLSEKGLSLLFVGRLVEYKKVDSILLACDKIKSNLDFRLDIIGDGPISNDLHKLASDLELSNVVFCGNLDRNSVQTFMKDADVFIMISVHETFGLVYIEAMLQGCLVIASRNGGVDGIIRDGENGFLCNEGDSDELAIILRRIVELPMEERKRISRNARKCALQFTDSIVAKRYLEDILR